MDRHEAWLHDRDAHRAPVDAHFAEALEWIEARPPDEWVFELGPGPQADLATRIRDTGRQIYTGEIAADTVETRFDLDISAAWLDCGQLPYKNASFGAVLAREVFEHVDDLPVMLSEIRRILRPDGRLWWSTPFIFPLHDYETGDYWRISDKGWRILLERAGFGQVECRHERLLWGSWQMPVSVVGWGDTRAITPLTLL